MGAQYHMLALVLMCAVPLIAGVSTCVGQQLGKPSSDPVDGSRWQATGPAGRHPAG